MWNLPETEEMISKGGISLENKRKGLILKSFRLDTFRKILHQSYGMYKDVRADYYLKIQIKKKNNLNDLIRVAFVVQMPEIWDKEEPVYSAMSEDPRFSVSVIVVPPYDQVAKKVSTDYRSNYFLRTYPGAIMAYQNGSWNVLEKDLDYVFYQRPYDHYLPIPLQSRTVVRLAKCCYIPYGYTGSDAFIEGSTNKTFFRNLYFGFAESAYMAEIFRKRYHGDRQQALHKIRFCGFPALIPYFDLKPTNVYHRILWTPRWSYAPKTGGSHFLEYKDIFLQLKKMMPALQLTFRPHPLLFGKMISSCLMSEKEIDAFLEQLSLDGIAYDNGDPIYETLQNTDILVTDYSSIIIQFFVTGRPIVFCESDIVLNDDFKMLSEGMYVVHNEEELLATVQKLVNGEDPLCVKRQKIIDKLFKEHQNATEKIIETIYQDYCDGC